MEISFDSNKGFTLYQLEMSESTWIQDFFTYKYSKRMYDYKKKSWYYESHENCVPKIISASSLYFPMGYIFVVTNILRYKLRPELIKDICYKFKNTEFKISNYYELQNIDDTYTKVNELLKTKRGVLSIPTGKGKTEIIATLAMNIMALGERVLITSEQGKVLEEITDRIRKLGHEFPKKRTPDDLIYIIKPSAFCRSYEFSDEFKSKFLANVKFLLTDEAETAPNGSFINKLFPAMPNCEYLYGFTATVNKLNSIGLPKDESLKHSLNEYSDGVISYFGFSVVNELPTGYTIHINTMMADIRVHPDITEYHKVVQTVANTELFGLIIKNILTREKTLLVALNSRISLDSLTSKSWIYSGKTIQINGDGCLLFDNNTFVTRITLQQAKDMIQSGEVRLVYGTVSSYRGIDFHGLYSVLISFDKQSAIVKQIVGRLTRGSEFSVYLVRPKDYVPYLRNAYWLSYKELKNYYKKCNLLYDRIDITR